MKRFNFPLDTLLRVRELREREAKRAVAAQQADLARIDRLSAATRREILNAHNYLREAQTGRRSESTEPAQTTIRQHEDVDGKLQTPNSKLQTSVFLHPAELARQRAWIAHLQVLLLQHQQMRAEAETKLAKALADLMQARTRTKTVEKLKSRRLAEYQKTKSHREQASADELAQQLHLLNRDGREP